MEKHLTAKQVRIVKNNLHLSNKAIAKKAESSIYMIAKTIKQLDLKKKKKQKPVKRKPKRQSSEIEITNPRPLRNFQKVYIEQLRCYIEVGANECAKTAKRNYINAVKNNKHRTTSMQILKGVC